MLLPEVQTFFQISLLFTECLFLFQDNVLHLGAVTVF